MTKDAIEQITRENQRRHAHNTYKTQSRCKHCKAFISRPKPENGRIQYVCNSCNRAIMEYVGTTHTVAQTD